MISTRHWRKPPRVNYDTDTSEAGKYIAMDRAAIAFSGGVDSTFLLKWLSMYSDMRLLP